MDSHPNDLSFMELTSNLWRKAGNTIQAIEIAERIRLRDPNQIKNKFHLIRLYLMSGNIPRAQSILNECKENMSPEQDEKWKKLKLALIRKSVS